MHGEKNVIKMTPNENYSPSQTLIVHFLFSQNSFTDDINYIFLNVFKNVNN